MVVENLTQTIAESQLNKNDDIVINVDLVGKMYKLFDQPIDGFNTPSFGDLGKNMVEILGID
jgi:hypothetical protein